MTATQDNVVEALRRCNTREEIEDTFERFGIREDGARYDNLLKAMYSPVIHSDANEHSKMKEVMKIFLTAKASMNLNGHTFAQWLAEE